MRVKFEKNKKNKITTSPAPFQHTYLIVSVDVDECNWVKYLGRSDTQIQRLLLFFFLHFNFPNKKKLYSNMRHKQRLTFTVFKWCVGVSALSHRFAHIRPLRSSRALCIDLC